MIIQLKTSKGNISRAHIECTEKGCTLFIFDTRKQDFIPIVFMDSNRKIFLDKNNWNLFSAVSQYMNRFLEEKTIDTKKKISQGIYKLINL